MNIDEICSGHDVSDTRKATLVSAIELGATDAALTKIRDARRVCRDSKTIVLPSQRYESLSRGRGWARMGKGPGAVWGERADGGYRVGPGRWTIGGNDGFTRKGEDMWDVSHVAVGEQIWTIAL